MSTELRENVAGLMAPRAATLLVSATNLFDRLLEVAYSRGEHAAVVHSRGSTSYRKLIGAATEFSAELVRTGVKSGDPVAVMLENRVEFVVAAFGIWKIGAVLVPLNERLQETELLRYVQEGNVSAVVTSKRMQPAVKFMRDQGAAIRRTFFCDADGNWDCSGVESAAAGDSSMPLVASHMPAVTQYSTGSTGTPKKVTRSHLNLLGEFAAVASVLQTTCDDRILGLAPFFHSHGLMNSAMQALLSGGTLYPVESFFPKDVARLIEQERITLAPGVPFMFQLLADVPEKRDLSSIRVAISAGAPLPVETASTFFEKYGIWIRPLYGSTETGVITIFRASEPIKDVGHVGMPIPGVHVSAVDDSGGTVPEGKEGRVHIVSPYAARRYDNSDGNSESFFDTTGFFPGDLGRVSPNGVVLSGRHRGFINVGGNKVDPSEVEQVLLQLAGIDEAVAFGLPDGAAGEKIKVVVVASRSLSLADVRAHCARRLSDFKRPRIVEFRDELPKSPLGKVLRKYLIDDSLAVPSQYVFDPGSGFRPAASARADDRTLNLAFLPPFLRVLLVTDGTVTKSLEAFFWEPVEVEVLSHAHGKTSTHHPNIGVQPGQDILRRRVLLRGKTTRTPYAFAESIMASDSVAGDLSRRLIDEKKGIGELLREGRGETHRELLHVKKSAAGELAEYLGVDRQALVLTRSYRIFHGGRAAIEIEEIFPVQRFALAR